jgi:cation diffusion facilitator family transporter
MLAEITGGCFSGSMALLADGFHLGTHVGALGISAFAYSYARRHARDPRYTFGTGKVSDLAGFASALILGMISLYILFESVTRLLAPVPILYGEAIALAMLGLVVNVASVFILNTAKAGHHHDHDDHHPVDHHHAHHHDHNFRSAYLHVMADAVTALLAIVALLCGWKLGWAFMDPLVGMIGAGVILSWTFSLLRNTTGVLLDRAPENQLVAQIRDIVAGQGAQVIDLHLWRVAPGAHAAIIAVASTDLLSTDQVRQWFKILSLAHLTVEINQVS